MFVITFDQVAHWWTGFENSFYTFQVVMYPNGDFYFNYLNFHLSPDLNQLYKSNMADHVPPFT